MSSFESTIQKILIKLEDLGDDPYHAYVDINDWLKKAWDSRTTFEDRIQFLVIYSCN